MVFTEKDYKNLSHTVFLFENCADALRRYGKSDMSEDYQKFIDKRFYFLVISLIEALRNFRDKTKFFLDEGKKNPNFSCSFTGEDVGVIMAARHWIFEIARIAYKNPDSLYTSFMKVNGSLHCGESKNGNRFVERDWRNYVDCMNDWLRIMYNDALIKSGMADAKKEEK